MIPPIRVKFRELILAEVRSGNDRPASLNPVRAEVVRWPELLHASDDGCAWQGCKAHRFKPAKYCEVHIRENIARAVDGSGS